MAKKQSVLIRFLILTFFISVISGLGCRREKIKVPVIDNYSYGFTITERDFLVGVAPIPRHFPGSNEEDWIAMHELLPEVAEIVNGQDGNWKHLVDNGLESSLVGFAGGMQMNEGISAMFGINYADARELHENGTLTIDWTSATDRKAYKDLAIQICTTYEAKYLALAIENNFHYRYRSEDYDLWVDAYNEIYDTVKSFCPNTKVFVTFQYEMIRGLGGNYWGTHEEEWQIIDKFGDRLDLIAFTSYPELEYDSLDEIPPDYYLEIVKHTDKPIAFTEIGWQDGGEDFIQEFTELTKGLNIEFVMWIFMHDTKMSENNPFPLIGLRDYDGNPKEAWFAWKALKELTYVGSAESK